MKCEFAPTLANIIIDRKLYVKIIYLCRYFMKYRLIAHSVLADLQRHLRFLQSDNVLENKEV